MLEKALKMMIKDCAEKVEDIPKGDYKSLISEEEMKALEDVKTAVKHLREAHDKHADVLFDRKRERTPELKEYKMFHNFTYDLYETVDAMIELNTRGVATVIAAHHEKGSPSYEEMLERELSNWGYDL